MTTPILPTKPPSERRVAIHITISAQRHVRSGHPWLFDGAITKQSHEGAPGDVAVVYDSKGKFLAAGLYDPFSPIRVRLLIHRKPAEINADWFLDKILDAAKIREPLLKTDTNGYRLVNGENDGLPGLIADVYAGTVVLKIYTAAWVPHLADVLLALTEMVNAERAILRMNRKAQERPEFLHGLTDEQTLFGPTLDGPVIFRENGHLFEADPIHGQKTGFFLDQRENRARVERLCGGQTVLNVFSYTGGFSLYAARGGAASVTNIDISSPAIEASKRNFELNAGNTRIAACPQEYIAGDAFGEMESLALDGNRYGVVIIDPPNFAKKKEEIDGALKSYSKLVSLGMALLRRGGTLVMASCSSRVGEDEFFRAVFSAAKLAGRPLAEIERTHHAIDHPITFPEGAYLKCLFAKG